MKFRNPVHTWHPVSFFDFLTRRSLPGNDTLRSDLSLPPPRDCQDLRRFVTQLTKTSPAHHNLAGAHDADVSSGELISSLLRIATRTFGNSHLMATHSLRNPHSILAALQHRPADVLELRINLKGASDPWLAVAALAREHQKPVHLPLVDPTRVVRSSVDGGRATGNEATVREIATVSPKSLFQKTDTPGLWLALDHIQDPHNVGAILRTAAFFGVRGVVMTRDQSAPLTSIVYDIASGGVEATPVAIVPNMVQVFEIAKEAGLWILGTSEHETRSVAQVDRDRDWLLVLGNEEKGLRRLVSERCDELCQIPSLGEVKSLNVSVASGVLMATLTAGRSK